MTDSGLCAISLVSFLTHKSMQRAFEVVSVITPLHLHSARKKKKACGPFKPFDSSTFQKSSISIPNKSMRTKRNIHDFDKFKTSSIVSAVGIGLGLGRVLQKVNMRIRLGKT